jgi:glutathione S-transferase
MDKLTLVIGNKNYSSWSLRPWILLRHLGLQFNEVLLPLDTPEFEARIGEYSPTRRVPVLRHGDVTVWDSLAIADYAVELAGCGWPVDRRARAHARAIAAEMHSGFGALRSQWPMNVRAQNRRTPVTPELKRDIARVEQIWSDCRARHQAGGPWLFGDYSVADAMYAPVVLRFRTYGEHFAATTRSYMDQVLTDPLLEPWLSAARAESWIVAQGELGA